MTQRQSANRGAVEASPFDGRITRAVIDLDAIANNVRSLRRVSAANLFMAVVKANGYGHGAVQIAKTALQSGADWLGVYAVGEGIELRRIGVSAPILVFGPFGATEARAIVEYGLRPTIADLHGVQLLHQAISHSSLPFHLKVDTGLRRAGVAADDALSLMQAITRLKSLRPEGIYTHFACADEVDRSTTEAQLARFREVVLGLERHGFSFNLRHAANSAATIAFPESHFDMVRCGIAIYGYYPSATVAHRVELRPALTLRSAVTRVQSVPVGGGVGYGHEFIATRPSTIALAPVGYGDGLPRVLGGGAGRVLVRGSFAPIVGRVSMDQITLDVTDIPDAACGDEVVIIGASGERRQSADDVAAPAGTISYEILTGIMPRVPRAYELDSGAPASSSGA